MPRDRHTPQDDAYLAIVDETGEPTTPDGLKVEATEWAATNPQIVWTGTEFVVAWNEELSVLVGRADADGTPIEGSARTVAPFAGEPDSPAHGAHLMNDLLWTGTDLLVLGVRATSGGTTETFALRLDAQGAPEPGSPTVVGSVSSEGGWSSEPPIGVVLGEREVAVVWGEIQHGYGESRIYFARLVLTGD